jgi:hypothetical protein
MTTDRAPPARTIALDGIDTASLQRIVDIDPAALEKIVWAIATAQKQLRSQRSLTGLAAARRRGQKLGRPLAMSEAEIATARRMMIAGALRETIARELNVSRSTLYLALKPYAAEAPPRPKPPGRSSTLTETQITLARRGRAEKTHRPETQNLSNHTLGRLQTLRRRSVPVNASPRPKAFARLPTHTVPGATKMKTLPTNSARTCAAPPSPPDRNPTYTLPY